MTQKILVLFAHPSQERSEINRLLFQACAAHKDVSAIDLYFEYPTFRINIDKEQQRLREHDVVIFLFPLYWYSTPSILKEWQDLVLEYGFAYGPGGVELHGKSFMCALTTGGNERDYQEEGYHHYTLNEFLLPLQQTASLCGMSYLAPFVLYDARSPVVIAKVDAHVADLNLLLTALAENKVDIPLAKTLARINSDLSLVITD